MRRPLLALLAAGALAAGFAVAPSATAARLVDPLGYGFQGEGGLDAETADLRVGSVLPTVQQRDLVAELGARATWNPFGTPKVLTRDDAGFFTGPSEAAPVEVAREFVRDHAVLFGLDADATTPARLAVVKAVPLTEGPQTRAKRLGQPVDWSDNAHVVTFRQVFDGRPAALDGLLTVGMDPQGRVGWASASTTADARVTNTVTLSMVDAYLAAARDARIEIDRDDVELLETLTPLGARVLRRAGVQDQQTVRLVAVPTPRDGVRLAFEAVVLRSLTDGVEHPHAYLSMVDAQTGEVLHRSNRLQHLSADGEHSAADAAEPGAGSVPYWAVFPNFPNLPLPGVVTPDNREFWCFVDGADCAVDLGTNGAGPNTASPYAYDENLLPDGTPVPTFATDGNNARTAISRVSQLTPDTAVPAASATRTYAFPFTDQWQQSKCDPASFASPELNDADAATANLFVMHNRMHDWGYFLGWTEENSNFQKENAGSEADTPERENDPEIGNSQSGSVAGGATFLGRDNANQVTLNDGTPGISNQYLWEPLQAGFYPPCVDGAYDMGIIGHEVGHGIQNRMTANSNGLNGTQSGSMGESWSDLSAMEYLNGYGYQYGTGLQRYSIAAYATGDATHGIRSYNMAASPLNYSDLEYDGNGTTSPHADGEIWSATQFDIRQRLVDFWEKRGFDADNAVLQAECADGVRASTACPGNRRWIQLIHDGFLLQPSATSMLDSRDAIIAADKLRYGQANARELWAGFARRGMGADAESVSADDVEAEAGFRSPLSTDTGRVAFRATVDAGELPEEIHVHVGDFEARTSPVAVLAGATPSAARPFEPGTYRLTVQAEGLGVRRTTMTVKADVTQTVTLDLRRNLASAANGAEATGDGGGLEFLIDDTEGTNWASLDEGAVEGKQVTVELAGGRQTVREVQVSAANRPALCDGATGDNPFEVVACSDGDAAPYDTGGQNRFAALRSFEILACDATAGSSCEEAGDFRSVLTARDAFPADRPRPTVKDLNLRAFSLPDTVATHLRIRVLDNQCTGGPAYTGAANPENNPLSDPDCESGALTTASAAGAPATTTDNSQFDRVRIAELQVFARRSTQAAVVPPVVAPPVVKPPVTQPGTLPTTGGLPLAGLGLVLVAGGAYAVRRVRCW